MLITLIPIQNEMFGNVLPIGQDSSTFKGETSYQMEAFYSVDPETAEK